MTFFSDVLGLWVYSTFSCVRIFPEVIQSCHIQSILVSCHRSRRPLVFLVVFSSGLISTLSVSLRILFFELSKILSRRSFTVLVFY